MASAAITDVRIRLPRKDAGSIVAWVSCVYGGALRLDNIEVRRRPNGSTCLRFPTRESRGRLPQHYFLPLDRATREAIERAIFERLPACRAGRTNGGDA